MKPTLWWSVGKMGSHVTTHKNFNYTLQYTHTIYGTKKYRFGTPFFNPAAIGIEIGAVVHTVVRGIVLQTCVQRHRRPCISIEGRSYVRKALWYRCLLLYNFHALGAHRFQNARLPPNSAFEGLASYTVIYKQVYVKSETDPRLL